MLGIQIVDICSHTLGDLLIGSYAAVVTNLITVLRNILNIKGKNSWVITLLLSAVLVMAGICVNTKGVIGLFPLLASVEYTVWSMRGKTAQSLRYALVICLLLWLIHDLYVRLIVSAITDVLTIIVTIINIIKYKRGGLRGGEIRGEN